MARTPLASILQKSFSAAGAELGQWNGQARIPEREITRVASSDSGDSLPQEGLDRRNRIVIVGAGLAGLTAAYRLRAMGIDSTIYEASDRVGGRCWTRRNYFQEHQIVERGGELIDSGHHEIRSLAAELGLTLDHLTDSEPTGTEPFFWFDRQRYSYAEVTEDFKRIYPKLKRDLEEAGESNFYDSYTPRGYELDQLSIVEYIDELVPGGSGSKFGRLLTLAYTLENGADAKEQSALNLLYLLGHAKEERFNLYGDSDECYHVRGGNDQIATLMAEQLAGRIAFHCPLRRIEQLADGQYRLIFGYSYRLWSTTASKVILALPHRALKGVDYRRAGLSPLKKTAIEELGMGVNTKLHAQFERRFWNELGNNGETYSDTGYQQTFESSRAQSGASGILVNYTGGEAAAGLYAETDKDVRRRTERFLDKLNPLFPGSRAHWNGLSTIDHWLSNQWSRGSYSYWGVGQYTKFGGAIGEREGNLFFAGEHTSSRYMGYLNGAVESGERVAREVAEDYMRERASNSAEI